MNRIKYYKKLNNKHKLRQQRFKTINVNFANKYLPFKIKIMSLKEFREYFENTINFENDTGCLIRPIFSFKIYTYQNKFDILVLNSKMEIIELLNNFGINNDIKYFKDPVSLLVLAANSISFHNFKINDKIKLSRFSY